jgi:hypothetical protein
MLVLLMSSDSWLYKSYSYQCLIRMKNPLASRLPESQDSSGSSRSDCFVSPDPVGLVVLHVWANAALRCSICLPHTTL